MVYAKFSNVSLTAEHKRVMVNLFKDPLATKAFIQFLNEVKGATKSEMDKTTQVYLMNDNPTTRALALQLKGKVEFLDELSTLIQTVVK